MSARQSGGEKRERIPAEPSRIGTAAKLLVSELNASTVLQTILELSMEAAGAHRGFLAMVDHDRGELSVQYTAGEGWNEQNRRLRLKVSEETGRGITSHVAATGRSYRSGDVSRDPYYILFFDDVRSELAVPLVDDSGRTRGVINVESPEFDAFNESHQEEVETLASIATAALVILELRARELALVEISKDLAEWSDIPALLLKIVQVTAEALRSEDCSLFLIDPTTGELTLKASRGGLASRVDRASYKIGEGLTGWVAREGKAIRTTEPWTDPRWRGLHCEFPPEEMGAFMAVPIVGRERILGVLRVLRKRSPYPWFPSDFSPEDERVLSIIGGQVGVALENAFLLEKLLEAQRMAAWGEMSARSAHMLGNRLFAVEGDVNELEYVLSTDSSNIAYMKELIASIRGGISGLEEILQEFREFVVATHLTLQECDLNELIRESVKESFPKRSNVKLTMELAHSLPLVKADPAKLKRCFSELIENSLQFQPEGGELSIATGIAEEEHKEQANVTRGCQFLLVSFRDRGPGIPEENKGRIFTPFFTTRSKGMGLGLSIVRGIIDAHRGAIYESGQSGSGACFNILLPCEATRDECVNSKGPS